jgi:hypothetical protein
MTRINPLQHEERVSFVLSCLKQRLSDLETRKQFRKQFKCNNNTARRWIGKVIEQERHRLHIAAMYNALFTLLSNDLIPLESAESIRTKIDRFKQENVRNRKGATAASVQPDNIDDLLHEIPM